MNRFFWFSLALFILPVSTRAQEFTMQSGLLNTPTAEVAQSGTVRIGGAWLNREITPDQFSYRGKKYDTANFGVGVAFFDWLEASFGFTLLKWKLAKYPERHARFYNEDRHVNVKVRPLKEGKWWPAIAVGMDDVDLPKYWGKPDEKGLWNNYYQNVYIVGSKHFDFGRGGELSLHLAYRYFTNKVNHEWRGIAGGVAYRPNFCRDLRVMAEWDGKNVNAGVDWLVWKRLYLQAGLTNGTRPFGVISYHYVIPF